MILLVSGATVVVREEAMRGARIGALLCPNSGNRIPEGMPWAADNAAFSGFNAKRYLNMLSRIEGRGDCMWVTVPDVVADAEATDLLWRYWARIVRAHGLATAYVGQDGMREIPSDANAFFLGGSTAWKLGPEAARWAIEAKARGLLVHMGRVNTMKRLRYAHAIGCDSVDGSSFSRFSRAHVPWAVGALEQKRLVVGD